MFGAGGRRKPKSFKLKMNVGDGLPLAPAAAATEDNDLPPPSAAAADPPPRPTTTTQLLPLLPPHPQEVRYEDHWR